MRKIVLGVGLLVLLTAQTSPAQTREGLWMGFGLGVGSQQADGSARSNTGAVGYLKREATRPPKANLRAQQRHFNDFRRTFNHIRPHEALDDATPNSVYRSAPRLALGGYTAVLSWYENSDITTR